MCRPVDVAGPPAARPPVPAEHGCGP
jgi:hypothetical protein